MVKEFLQFASSTVFMDQVMFQSVPTPRGIQGALKQRKYDTRIDLLLSKLEALIAGLFASTIILI